MTVGERRAGNLPAETTSLVGREAELVRVHRAAARSRLVTVTGVAGVGKTRLALRAAARLRPRFADGAWLVELSALDEGALLAHDIAEALPLADHSTRPMIDVVAEYLAERETLLVLDTCEHLIDACALTAEVLLRAAPRLRILATSRRPLGLADEEIVTVEPFPVAGPGSQGREDALRLLTERAAAVVPGFAVTSAGRADLLRLVQRLEGLPLAIELAAPRLAELPASTLTERLDDRFALLGDTEDDPPGTGAPEKVPHGAEPPGPGSSGTGSSGTGSSGTGSSGTGSSGTGPPPASPPGTAPPETDPPETGPAEPRWDAAPEADPPWHRALRTAIGWSHELCSPSERLLWARLSVFAGGFDAEAVQHVCSDERLPAGTIPALLGALAEASILTWAPTGGGERYRMLDTIREYGAHWLAALGEERALRRRHREHFLKLARDSDAHWLGPDQFLWYDRMTGEHDNLRAALEHSLAEPDEHDEHGAVELAGALWLLWHACGFPKEGQYYLERALAHDPGPSRARNKAMLACGWVMVDQGDAAAAEEWAAECAAAAGRDGDADSVAVASSLTMSAAMMRGDLKRAATLAEDLLAVHSLDGGLTHPPLSALAILGHALLAEGRGDDAIAVLERLRATCDRHGERWVRAWAEFWLARAELARGRPAAAHAHAQAALEVKYRLHDSVGLAMAFDVLATAAPAIGQTERAARLLGLGQQIWDSLGLAQIGIPEFVAARLSCEREVRDALGERAYRDAFRTGYATDLDTGVAYALSPLPS